MAKPATRDNSSLALAIALRAAELGADSVHQRDHAFELGRVLRVWTALRMHIRVRTEKVAYRLVRGHHLRDERARELQVRSIDPHHVAGGRRCAETIAKMVCRLAQGQRTNLKRHGAVPLAPLLDDAAGFDGARRSEPAARAQPSIGLDIPVHRTCAARL